MVKYKYYLHLEISAVELQQIHQHFVASLVILVFAESSHSFLSLKRLFLPSSKSINLCKWKHEFAD